MSYVEGDIIGNDFQDLIKDIEAEAEASGPADVDELRDLRREFTIAADLASHRREAKLTQKQLAKASGIPQSEISRIETGRSNPTTATLNALAEPLGARVGLVTKN